MLTDVPGIQVGHAERTGGGWSTGVTVVIPPPGTVAAVDVRGGGPGTHETDALAPGTLVDSADAIALCGGSAYGLVAAHGVQRWCEQAGRGFVVGAHPDGAPLVVPIVPAAAIFDIGRGGDVTARPDEAMGFDAAVAASSRPFRRGPVGAGTGARTQAGNAPGGVGTASLTLPGGVVVAALAVVNAAGRVLGLDDGAAAARDDAAPQVAGGGSSRGPQGQPSQQGAHGSGGARLNTTLAVVATNARMDVAAATRMAGAGHDGLARAISPVHTLMDGDTVFALATGDLECAEAVGDESGDWPGARTVRGLATIQAAAADVVTAAVRDAVRHEIPTD